MTDMTMVERVARAMWETGPGAPEWDTFSLQAVPYLIWARAAIEAKREPTSAMVQVGADEIGATSHNAWSSWEVAEKVAICTHRAMIDAALA